MLASTTDRRATNALLRELIGHGLTLRRFHGRLVVSPEALISDPLDAMIRANKQEFRILRGCPVYGCGQLLPWGEIDTHVCTPRSLDPAKRGNHHV